MRSIARRASTHLLEKRALFHSRASEWSIDSESLQLVECHPSTLLSLHSEVLKGVSESGRRRMDLLSSFWACYLQDYSWWDPEAVQRSRHRGRGRDVSEKDPCGKSVRRRWLEETPRETHSHELAELHVNRLEGIPAWCSVNFRWTSNLLSHCRKSTRLERISVFG